MQQLHSQLESPFPSLTMGGDGKLSDGKSPATGQRVRESFCWQHSQSVGHREMLG